MCFTWPGLSSEAGSSGHTTAPGDTVAWAGALLPPAQRREGSGRPRKRGQTPRRLRLLLGQIPVAAGLARGLSPVASNPARDPELDLGPWVPHVPPPPPGARRPGPAGRGLSDVSQHPASSAQGCRLRGDAPATRSASPRARAALSFGGCCLSCWILKSPRSTGRSVTIKRAQMTCSVARVTEKAMGMQEDGGQAGPRPSRERLGTSSPKPGDSGGGPPVRGCFAF